MLVLIGMFSHAFEDGSMSSSDGGSESSSVLVQSFVSWLSAWTILEVVTLLYRMDYAFALESGQIAAPAARLRLPEGTTRSDAKSTGKPEENSYIVRVPASLKFTFNKPYFNASIAGFIVSVLLWASFAAYFDAHPDAPVSQFAARTMLEVGPEWIRFHLNGVAAPFVCAFPMALAYMRGESRKVWDYKEMWMDGPECVPQDVVSSETLPRARESFAIKSSTWLELCEGKDVREKRRRRV